MISGNRALLVYLVFDVVYTYRNERKINIKVDFLLQKFGGFKKMLYLCTVKQKQL